MEVSLQTGWGIFEVLAQVSRSPLEAFRQFIENAADAIEQRGKAEGVIRLQFQKDGSGALSQMAVEDNGVGMDPQKMAEVLRTIGLSNKIHLALRGEKGIGILAFALLAQELHLNSCPQEGGPSACLVLRRQELKEGKAALLDPCPLHSRYTQGTTAYLLDVLPEVANSLSAPRLKEFLGREFASDLRRNLYSLLLEDRGRWETVEPQRLRGLRILSRTLQLGASGHATIELHLLPAEAPDAAISLYGESGVRICSLTALEAFQRMPWENRQVEGFIRCDRLKRTADKTAVIQDRVYQELVAALQLLEPELSREVSRVSQQHLEQRVGRVMRRVDQMVERFLRYLEDGEPLRVPAPRAMAVGGRPSHRPSNGNGHAHHNGNGRRPVLQPIHFQFATPAATSQPEWRSWRDSGEMVLVNKAHSDFLEAEQDDARCARYLFALWAKEHLLAEYSSDARRLAEELVGLLLKADPMLVRSSSR